LNGVNTLRYPPSVGVGVLEINDDDFAALDYDCWEKYKVENGEIIDNPNYKPPFDAETKTTNLEEQVIDLQLALCEMYETMTETEE
jgi:hypothetical protein